VRRDLSFAKLKRLLPAGELSTEQAIRQEHAGDKWFAAHVPDAVAFPRSTESVAKILRFAYQNKIPITARGAGVGYVGGCVPMQGGIALSLAKMKRIKEINDRDFVAVVQAGVITKDLQVACEKKGLFYPPDPASRADCTLGGNIVTNAGGPRCLKYGVTRDYVLGLQVVLSDGMVVDLGSRTHKNKTGFDLARMFVGSEGMLGIVTEATLKLLPLPPYRAALSVGFASMKAAALAIRTIFASGFLPCAVEVADAFTLRAAQKRTGNASLAGCNAHLIVELDGQEKSVRSEIETLRNILGGLQPVFLKYAFGPDGCEEIWQLRREFSYSLRDTGLKKLNQDIVVPRGRLEDLFSFAARLQKKYGFPIACFGHAGDGNLHVNVMINAKDPREVERSTNALDELFKQVLAWKGVITGEHGIGLAKKPWWNLAISPEAQRLHHMVKDALDPRGILNPAKFL
jgi:glycolate oxidase subunit GlcD